MTLTPVRRYSRGADLVSIRDVQGNKSYVPHFDHQGTIQCLTDRDTGAVTDTFAADAWGVQVQRTGTSINRQWYIGGFGYVRAAPGHDYSVRARAYRTAQGIWSSRDPLSSYANYTYCLNTPAHFIDPTGLICNTMEFIYEYPLGDRLTPLRSYLPPALAGLQQLAMRLRYKRDICDNTCGCPAYRLRVAESLDAQVQITEKWPIPCYVPPPLALLAPFINSTFDCYFVATVVGQVAVVVVKDPCDACAARSQDTLAIEIHIAYEMSSKGSFICGFSSQGRSRLRLEQSKDCCDDSCETHTRLQGCLDLRVCLKCGQYSGCSNALQGCVSITL